MKVRAVRSEVDVLRLRLGRAIGCVRGRELILLLPPGEPYGSFNLLWLFLVVSGYNFLFVFGLHEMDSLRFFPSLPKSPTWESEKNSFF